MKHIWGIFFIYLFVPMALYLHVNPDVDQFGKAISFSPLFLFVPFVVIFSVILSLMRYKNKLRRIFDIVMFSLIFSISSCFIVLILNMYVGAQENLTIAGVVVEKLPGRGNSKPVLKIESAGVLVDLCIIRKEWEAATVGNIFSIDVKKGSLGLFYRRNT